MPCILCILSISQTVWSCRYPSHARMWMAPIKTRSVQQRAGSYNVVMQEWNTFVDDTKAYYGVDMGVLTNPYSAEQKKYYLQVAIT